MQNLKIFFADDSEYSETVSVANGSRSDVLVQIDDNLYHPTFYDIFALTQEFNESVAAGMVYNIDNNIILVSKTSREEIVKSILYLVNYGYFEKVKTIDLKKEFKDSFQIYPHLSDLSGWKLIY